MPSPISNFRIGFFNSVCGELKSFAASVPGTVALMMDLSRTGGLDEDVGSRFYLSGLQLVLFSIADGVYEPEVFHLDLLLGLRTLYPGGF
jgi:hypothetical protein